MPFVDTHCHLSFPPLSDDLEGVLSRARQRDVVRIIVPAYDLASWDGVERGGELSGVYPAFGLHPWAAQEPLDVTELASRLVSTKAAAVGEIGLDFKVDSADRGRQIEILRQQLEIAIKLDLPVLLHCRGAFEELHSVLCEFAPQLRGVLHSFSKSPELMQPFIDLGLHIGFGGAVTRLNAAKAKRSGAIAPANRIVLETDAPSIGLDGVYPHDVEPHHVVDIARCLAQMRGETVEEISTSTTSNAKGLFGFE